MSINIGPGSLLAAALLAGQLASVAAAWPRRQGDGNRISLQNQAGLTIIRPLSGIDAFSEATLRSTFELDCESVRLLFFVAHSVDPIVPLIRKLIAEYPEADADTDWQRANAPHLRVVDRVA